MNPIRCFPAAVAFFCLAASPLVAQNPGMQQPASLDHWTRLEKEFDLQPRFSADMEIQAMGMTLPAKLYRLPGKTRTDTTLPMLNMRMVNLEVEENGQKIHYAVFPDRKMYCIQKEKPATAMGAYEISDAGTETFEGVVCRKRRLTATLPDGGSLAMEILFSPAQRNMPVKIVSQVATRPSPDQPITTVDSVVLFRNYQFDPPAAALFEIPSDYARAENMQAIIMSGLFGGAAKPGAAPAPEQPNLKALMRQAQEAAAPQKDAPDDEGAKAIRGALQNLIRQKGN